MKRQSEATLDVFLQRRDHTRNSTLTFQPSCEETSEDNTTFPLKVGKTYKRRKSNGNVHTSPSDNLKRYSSQETAQNSQNESQESFDDEILSVPQSMPKPRSSNGGDGQKCHLKESIKAKASIKGAKNSLQYCLDLGQKDFGAFTCKECGMVYTKGLEEDEELHTKFHRLHESSLSSPFLLKIGSHVGGDKSVTFIKISSSIFQQSLKKIQPILDIVNTELGFSDPRPSSDEFQVIFALTPKKRVIAMLILERITTAHPIIPTLDANGSQSTSENVDSSQKSLSENSSRFYLTSSQVDALCGIHTIWVHSAHRNKGIARSMMEIARNELVFGFTVPKDKIAISHPSELGVMFATKYLGPRFLVY
eukprot:TRINITY_DN16032_c0_g1_i1.p1 TRINITY_DN16032_c0_g1~~TRINITY_DN16032_c0_g1_i1.p1  ORF type:complete len:364 (+),score=72.20 TRINITY_DN16032_c0_g1_i1:50-1141(+)